MHKCTPQQIIFADFYKSYFSGTRDRDGPAPSAPPGWPRPAFLANPSAIAAAAPGAATTAPALDDKLAVKREAVGLYEQVGAAEARRGELQAPQQERDRLLAQVKEDNEEISMMEWQIVKAQDRARSLAEDRDQLDQDLEENQSERNQKYRELKKREETMDQFLGAFDELGRVGQVQCSMDCSALQCSAVQCRSGPSS
jgi:septal ring factor EnvC (AmiA/AmiB activator)